MAEDTWYGMAMLLIYAVGAFLLLWPFLFRMTSEDSIVRNKRFRNAVVAILWTSLLVYFGIAIATR